MTSNLCTKYKHFNLYLLMRLIKGVGRPIPSIAVTHVNNRKAVNVTSNRIFLKIYMNCIHNPFVNPELINSTYPEKWSTLYSILYKKMTKFDSCFFPHKLPKSKIISNMHISDIQCIYNWSAKHQIPTLETVVHCIICSITHKSSKIKSQSK